LVTQLVVDNYNIIIMGGDDSAVLIQVIERFPTSIVLHVTSRVLC